MLKGIIWDLDGTLLNTLDDLSDSVNRALISCGHPARSRAEIRSYVGNGVKNLIDRAVPSGTAPEESARVFAAFKADYAVHNQDKTAPYPGIPELIRSLKDRGLSMAVVSNKYDKAVKELIRHFFGDLIGVAIGEQAGIQRKPAPDTVFKALEELNINAADAVYIGDSEVDVATAANSGMPEIAVLWGFRDRIDNEKAGASVFAETPEELEQILEAWQ